MTRFHYASSQDSDLLYIAQYWITDPFFFLEHEGKQYVFLSSTDREAFVEASPAAERVEVVDVGPLALLAAQKPGDQTGNLAVLILKEYEATEPVTIPKNFPVSVADALRGEGIELLVAHQWAPERAIKSPAEIDIIRDNFENTKKAFELIEKILTDATISNDGLDIIHDTKPLTSEFLKREVGKLLLDYDLTSPEDMVISCGKHAAMPHHNGAGPIKAHETIVVDIFPQSRQNFYFADMTRTYVKGEPTERVQQMYEAVKASQAAALASLAPGKTGKEIYEVSAKVIKDHGFDVGGIHGYTHSLGHGLGVAVHEVPNLSLRSDTLLEPGHVVTVEPGLYYLEDGGVRVEDTVMITDDGYENLTNYPQNWTIPKT